MTTVKPPRKPARERILETACELFYREGIQHVGVDRIIAESGVAKMSLYNHFKSKDALIEAFLRRRDRQWRQWFVTRVEQHSADPKAQLLAVFDVLQDWMDGEHFRGCAFVNATVELADPQHPGYQAAAEHKEVVAQYLLSLAEAAGVPNPQAIAHQFRLLVEGAVIVAMLQGDASAAATAKDAAAILLTAQTQSAQV